MGQEIAERRLTEKQTLFVENYMKCGEAVEAARRSGYSPGTAASFGPGMLRLPHILAAIQSDVKRGFVAEAPNSVRVLVELRDHSKSDKVRADCAKTLLERAGHVAPRAALPDKAGETPLHEMTVDQLKDLAGRLEGELAGRAKVVNSANTSATDTQAIDLVG